MSANGIELVIAAAAVAAMVVTSGTAVADPTPEPSPPGYQVITPGGPVFPGMQQYQPTCLVAPLACNLKYNPATGTWQPGTASP